MNTPENDGSYSEGLRQESLTAGSYGSDRILAFHHCWEAALGEDSEQISTSKVPGVIPFFFYDAIARIIPGTFLLAGILLTVKGDQLLADWPAVVQGPFQKDLGLGYSTMIVLLFLGATYFLGSVLGSLSHALIERPWRCKCPLNLNGLQKYVGANGPEDLKARFKRRFGTDLNDGNLDDLSFLCSYHVWTLDHNLGAMSARVDAERLAAQSCVLVGVGLTVAAAIKVAWQFFHSGKCDWIWLVSVLVITAGSILSFNHLRKRRVYGRFAMFLSTSTEQKEHHSSGAASEK